MIDAADNNDDVVGGPRQNVTQETVHEFRMANRGNRACQRPASLAVVRARIGPKP